MPARASEPREAGQPAACSSGHLGVWFPGRGHPSSGGFQHLWRISAFVAIHFSASVLQCFKQAVLSCCKTEWHSQTLLRSHVPGLCSKQREVAGRPRHPLFLCPPALRQDHWPDTRVASAGSPWLPPCPGWGGLAGEQGEGRAPGGQWAWRDLAPPPTGRLDPAGSCSRSLARYVPWGWGAPRPPCLQGLMAVSLPPAGPCSAAWPSCGRRGSGGGGGRRSTACTTTASAGATVASAAPTSTTPRRWPCAPGASPTPRRARGGGGPQLPWAPAPQTRPVYAGLSGEPARRRTGPAPSPTTSPRRR